MRKLIKQAGLSVDEFNALYAHSEKAVKAVFEKMGAAAWGHSVADLLVELSKKHRISEEFMNHALELDKAYIPTRYPKMLILQALRRKTGGFP